MDSLNGACKCLEQPVEGGCFNLRGKIPKELDYWLGAKCKVIDVIARGFAGCREYCYELLHPNGRKCEFKPDELDRRFIRKH